MKLQQTQAERIENLRPRCAAIIRHKTKPIVGLLFRPEPTGRCCFALFTGTRARPDKWFSMRNQNEARGMLEQMWKAAEARFEQKAQTQAARAQQRAKLRAADHFTVGDVLVNTWGYEQTNVDFYQVVAVLARSIKIRRLNDKRAETGFMTGRCQPDRYNFAGKEMLKPLREDGSVSFEFGGYSKWDGRQQSYSNYA